MMKNSLPFCVTHSNCDLNFGKPCEEVGHFKHITQCGEDNAMTTFQSRKAKKLLEELEIVNHSW
jgi:hypothetical protein